MFRRPLAGRWILLWLSCLMAGSLTAGAEMVYVDSICVQGNERTKTAVILRELDFRPGDSLPMSDLQPCLERNRLYLMNTGLFSEVLLNVRDWQVPDNRLVISVRVQEAWYFYLIPLFELADRNFNLWWRDYEHDFRRINAGFILHHANVTGRRDRLKITAQLGFTRKLDLDYALPFFDRVQRWGLGFRLFLSDSQYLRYNTVDNKEVFRYDPSERLLHRFQLIGRLQRRPALHSLQRLEMGFFRTRIAAVVAEDLNPDFLGEGRPLQRYFLLRYTFEWDDRDVRPYPRRGMYLSFSLEKRGLGVFKELRAAYGEVLLKHYLPLRRRAGLESIFRSRIAIQRGPQPYYNSRALGYGKDFLRGYEYYLVDGLDMAFAKWSLRLPLWNRVWNWGKAMPVAGLRKMPLRLYFCVNGDLGYVHNPWHGAGNSLSDSWLWSTGVGLDIVSYYDKVFQIQLSGNRLGEIGLFLHWDF